MVPINDQINYSDAECSNANSSNSQNTSYDSDDDNENQCIESSMSSNTIDDHSSNINSNRSLFKNFKLIVHKDEPSNGDISKYLQIKDELNISDDQWQKLRKFMLNNKLSVQHFPPIYKLKEYRHTENQKIAVNENEKGFYKDPKEQIKLYLSELIEKLEIDCKSPRNAIRLKFTADKAFITRFKSLLNFAFSCINDEGNLFLFIYLIKLERQ